jgi:chorismate mutase
METEPRDKELPAWIEQTPGLREQLEALRELAEEPGAPGSLGQMELALVERMRQMGRVALAKWVQDQEGRAHDREQVGSRAHSKKN